MKTDIEKAKKEVEKAKKKLKKLLDRDALRKKKGVAKNATHKLFRTGTVEKPKFETLCGRRLKKKIKVAKWKEMWFGDHFENSSFYESEIDCIFCKKMMRPHAGNCRKCGCEFDTLKQTYCGNCGEDTRRKYPRRRKKI